MQQFLADSPWDPVLVVQAVAERVAAAIDVQAWVLDDTGFPKDGKDSPGVKRQYSGTLGKTGNCRSASPCTRSVPGGRWRWDGRCICRRSGAMTRSGARRQRSPRRSSFRPSPSLRQGSSSARPPGRSPGRRSSAIAPTGRTPRCASGSTTPALSMCCRSPRRSACSRPRRSSRCQRPAAPGRAARRPPQPDRKPEQLGALIARLGPQAVPDCHLPRRPRR